MSQQPNGYFSAIPAFNYEGPKSHNPSSYKHYDPTDPKAAKELRISLPYWHTVNGNGSDPFGAPTLIRPWMTAPMTEEMSNLRMDAMFDLLVKLRVPYFTFHDADIMVPGETPQEYVRNLHKAVDRLEQKMQETGVQLGWGTANLFSHPMYLAGAATNPEREVFEFACLQVKECMDATHRLGGQGYVFWGGREGYSTLLNTDMRRESQQMAALLHMAVDYKRQIGFTGSLFIEPKPLEPTTHQYDRDVATVFSFLQQYGLQHAIKANIENNHATLAGHSFQHEIALACTLNFFGSIDANRGDPRVGWDTDQMPEYNMDLVLAWREIQKAGGLARTGGVSNLDAKLRRESVSPEDVFHAYGGAIDALARARKAAHLITQDGRLDRYLTTRYASWDELGGTEILSRHLGLEQIAEGTLRRNTRPQPKSGRQEYLENLLSQLVLGA